MIDGLIYIAVLQNGMQNTNIKYIDHYGVVLADRFSLLYMQKILQAWDLSLSLWNLGVLYQWFIKWLYVTQM
jgi:hypothetical protein